MSSANAGYGRTLGRFRLTILSPNGLAARPDHRFDIDELFPRCALAGGAFFGFLDLLPVAEGDHVEAPLGGELVEAFAASLAAPAERTRVDVLGDLLDD